MKNYLQLLRIHYNIKNALIFLPLIFSGQLLNLILLKNAIYGFLAFSFIFSAVYIINDLEYDRKNSIKCCRPIASGKVPIKSPGIWLQHCWSWE
jgi:decaprenyl-phosphate phosphoribosyltransferase